jgi:lysophospholipase L1-like esterase
MGKMYPAGTFPDHTHALGPVVIGDTVTIGSTSYTCKVGSTATTKPAWASAGQGPSGSAVDQTARDAAAQALQTAHQANTRAMTPGPQGSAGVAGATGPAGAAAVVPMSPLVWPKVALVGDSTMQRNDSPFTGSALEPLGTGEVTWARIFYPYFDMTSWATSSVDVGFDGMNQAHSGYLAADCYQKMTRAMNLGANVVMVCVGTNDIAYNRTVASTIADIKTLVGMGLTRGARVLLWTIRPYAAPSSAPSITAAMRNAVDAVNAELRLYAAATAGVTLFDAYAVYVDPAVPQQARANWLDDHVHQSSFGAQEAGKSLASLLQRVIQRSALRTYSSPAISRNPRMKQGTGGTLSGTGVTGIVAQDWMISRSGTATVAAAFDTMDSLSQKLTVTAGSTDSQVIMLSNFGGEPAVVGQWYRMVGEIDLSAWAGWRGISVFDSGARGGLNGSPPAGQVCGNFTGIPRTLVIEGHPFQATSTSLTEQLRLEINANAAGTGTATVRRLGYYPVDAPVMN